MDTVALVREFEVACGATLPATPTQPTVEKLKLRLSLELEELYEKAQAMGLEGTFQRMMESKIPDVDGYLFDYAEDTHEYDQVALLDACCDQRYVQDGTVLTCGLQDVFYPAFQEVQRSNMSKFGQDGEDVMGTVEKYIEQGVDIKVTLSQNDTVFPATYKRASDGKILKSINYSPAELTQFFKA